MELTVAHRLHHVLAQHQVLHVGRRQDDALLAYVSPTVGLMTPTAFQTFVWPEAGTANGFGVATKKYRLPESLESDRVETELWVSFVLTSTLLGEMFINTVT